MSDQKPWEDFVQQPAGSAAPKAAPKPWEEFGGTTQPEGKGVLGHARDFGLSVAQGVVGVPEAAVGLADIATGGQVGKFLENQDGAIGFRPKQTREFLGSLMTDASKQQQQDFQDADGVIDKTKVALSNPSLITNAVGQSLPLMGAGGVAGRAVSMIPRIGGAVAGAVGEGVAGAGSAAEQIRQETDDGLLTGKQAGLAAASGASTALFGAVAGKAAQRLGIGDIDTLLATGGPSAVAATPRTASKSLPRKALEGAISEGFLEELPQSLSEQVLQNLALDKPWTEGLSDQAVMGVLSGGLMGGIAGPIHAGSPEAKAAPTLVPAQSEQQRPVALLPPPVYDVGADGVIRTTEDRNTALDRARRGEFTDVTPAPAEQPIAEPAPLQLPAPVYQAGADGVVRTTADLNNATQVDAQARADRLDRIRRGEVLDVTPIEGAPTASEQMGLNPAAGPMSAAAALAVDNGASQHMAQHAAQQQDKQIDPETGEITAGAQGSLLGNDPATELQGRLHFIQQTARANGWDMRLVAERDRVQAELAKLLPQQEQQAQPSTASQQAPTTAQESARQASAAPVANVNATPSAPNLEAANAGQPQQQPQAAPQPEAAAAQPQPAPAAATPAVLAPADRQPANLKEAIAKVRRNKAAQEQSARRGARDNAALHEGLAYTRRRDADLAGDVRQGGARSKQGDGAIKIPLGSAVSEVGSGNSSFSKGLVNRAGREAEVRRDSVDGPTLSTEGDGLVERPGESSLVEDHMLGLRHDLKIRDVVVQPVAVDVVNDLGTQKLATKSTLHDNAMLESLPPNAVDGDANESVGSSMIRKVADMTASAGSTQSVPQMVKHNRTVELAKSREARKSSVGLRETPTHESTSEFPLKEAAGSYSGISHSGGQRAKADAEEFQAYMDAAREAGMAVAHSDAQKAAVGQAAAALREDYLAQYRRLMGVRAGTYSGYVAGRSGLNSKQADKRNSAYDRAIDTFTSWQKANTDRVRQAALDARTDGEKAADQRAADDRRADKAQRKEDADRGLMRKILSWKKGGAAVAITKNANLAGVNHGRDGYPTSIKLAPTDGSTLADDKFELGALFRQRGMNVPDSKRRVRALVDTVRAEVPVETLAAEPSTAVTQPGAASTGGDAVQFSFAGRRARGADLHALVSAQQRLAAGENGEAVRRETGWHLGADGKWRFEISDHLASIAVPGSTARSVVDAARVNAMNSGGSSPTIADVLVHPRLFAAYPRLARIRIAMMPANATADARIRHLATGPVVEVQPGMERDMLASAVLHELQHEIQHAEGFAKGGSVDRFTSDFDKAGAVTYRRLAGEVEARNTQERMRMTPRQRREISPEESADVRASRVLVTFNGRDIVDGELPQNITGQPLMDAQKLLRAFDLQFPQLGKAVRTMLERGRRGMRGGVVMIDNNDPLQIAHAYATKTGTALTKAIELFEDGGLINGFYDAKSGLTFLVGPNLDPITAPAVLLHEMTHGQQRKKLDQHAANLLSKRAGVRDRSLREFLDRAASRMAAAGEEGNSPEAAAYIVEQAVIEGRSQGFVVADNRFLAWVDQTIGPRVGDLLRSLLVIIRQWKLRNGVGVGEISVDDFVGYAMAGMERAARGDVRGGGVAMSRDQEEVARARVLQGEPVVVLQGDEAPRGYPLLRAWATKVFEKAGGVAVNPELGSVVLDERAVRDSMAHGMNAFKAVAFAAVPDVLERGVVVLKARHGRDQNSYYVSAPVRIKGVDDVVTVLVRKDPNTQRMYLHSVTTKEGLLRDQSIYVGANENLPSQRVSGADTSSVAQPSGSSSSGEVGSVLQSQSHETAGGKKGGLPRARYSGTDAASGVERSGKVTSGEVSNVLRHLLTIKLDANGPDGNATDDGIQFSRSGLRAVAGRATQELNKTFSAPGGLSWWHKTIGTMYNLAQRSPAFRPVFESAQGFIDDVSHYANDAADMAPKLLPKLDTWRDIAKAPVSAADNKAVATPIFEGTLLWTRDTSGKPARVADLADAAARLSTEDKAAILLEQGKIPEGMLRAWRGHSEEQFARLIDSRFESQLLKAGIVWTDAELRSQFKLSDEQVALYHEFRAATDRSLDTMARADMLRYAGEDAKELRDRVMDARDVRAAAIILRDHLAEMADARPDRAKHLMELAHGVMDRAEKVTQLQAEGYAPLSRFGKYTVDVVDQAGERQYFGLFETRRVANQMAEQMRGAFPDAAVNQGTLSEESYKLFAGITPETLELFGNSLGFDSQGDSERDQAFQEYLRLTKTNRSAMRRLIHRKGIAGYSEDVGRVLASFIYSNSRQTAAGLHMGDLSEAVDAIPKEQGELKDAAVRLADYIKNPQEEAQAVRGLLFAQYLGGSVASALVNMTQPAAVTFPWLSQFGGARKAAAELGRAARQMATKGFQYEADLARALHDAEEDGTVSPQEVHQLMAQARGSGSLRSGDGTRLGDARALGSNSLSRLSVAWGKLFGAAEQVNRRVTFIAAYRMAKARDMADPAAFARRAVTETQFVYSKASKMQWGRGAVGGTLLTFKTYSIAYLELMSRLWSQGEAGSQERKDGRKAALLMLATLMLLGGAGGLPFAEDADDVVDAMAQIAGYNFSAKKAKQEFLESVFGRDIASFIDKGITGLPGMPLDVSGRLGMGNLIPGTGLMRESNDHTRDVLEIVGPAGDFASRTVSGARKVAGGDIGAGLLDAAPTAVRNLAKGADMAATGMYRDTKGYKVLDTNALEAALKAAGFQPSSVATIQEANGLNQQAKAFYNLRAQEIRALWAQGIFEKDQAKVQEARDAVADWNAKNPDQQMVVRMPDVLRRVREMAKPKDQRIADTAPKAMRQQMREDVARARADL